MPSVLGQTAPALHPGSLSSQPVLPQRCPQPAAHSGGSSEPGLHREGNSMRHSESQSATRPPLFIVSMEWNCDGCKNKCVLIASPAACQGKDDFRRNLLRGCASASRKRLLRRSDVPQRHHPCGRRGMHKIIGSMAHDACASRLAFGVVCQGREIAPHDEHGDALHEAMQEHAACGPSPHL